MTESTNGQTSSKDEQLKKFEEILNEYEKGIGLDGLRMNPDVELYLNLTSGQLAGMTALHCGEAAFILFQYSAFLQKEYNRQNVRRTWAENKIDMMVAKDGDQYGDKYTKWIEKRYKLISGNTAARVVNNIVLHATSRCNALHELSNRVNSMGRVLLEYQATKSRAGL